MPTYAVVSKINYTNGAIAYPDGKVRAKIFESREEAEQELTRLQALIAEHQNQWVRQFGNDELFEEFVELEVENDE